MTRHHLSDKEWEVARGLVALGKNHTEVGKILGCSRSTISRGLGEKKVTVFVPPKPTVETPTKSSLEDKIVVALEQMRGNGKKSFTILDIQKALLMEASGPGIMHYITGRFGKVQERVKFHRSGKVGARFVYTFDNVITAQATLSPRVVESHVSDRSIAHVVLDLERRVEQLEKREASA